jgi:putative chitinase
MQPWTREELHRFAPPPARRERDEEHEDERLTIHAAYIQTLLESWQGIVNGGVNTPLRLAMFLSIVGHETGGFTIGDENCTWSYARMCELWPQRFKATDPVMRARFMACRGNEESIAELAYGGWNDLGKRLGNNQPGDGFAFRGRGLFQSTGRACYMQLGEAIGLDLVGDPDQLDDPRVSIQVVLWHWQRYRLGEMADRNHLRAVHNQINRGNPHSSKDPIGWESRQRWFRRAWEIFGRGASLPSPLDLTVGAHGPEVRAAQMRLRELGYAVGAPDGIFGHETRRGLAAFKSDWHAATGMELEPGDVIGQATREALAVAGPIKRPERELMTVADLKAAGSTEVAAGLNLQNLAKPVLALSAIGGVASGEGTPQPPPVDPTPALQQAVGWVPTAKAIIVPVIEAAQWAVKHWWWVGGIALAVWLYADGWLVIRARLRAARQGLNLWR